MVMKEHVISTVRLTDVILLVFGKQLSSMTRKNKINQTLETHKTKTKEKCQDKFLGGFGVFMEFVANKKHKENSLSHPISSEQKQAFSQKQRINLYSVLLRLATMEENIVFICSLICNQEQHLSTLGACRSKSHIVIHKQTQQSGTSDIRTSEKPPNIHSDEAAAATNQSVLKTALETTRLQDTFPSCSIAHVGIPQVAAVQTRHICQPMYMTTGSCSRSGWEANGQFL